MTGPATLACIDGSHWNGTEPSCELIKQLNDQPEVEVISTAISQLPSYFIMLSAILTLNYGHSD